MHHEIAYELVRKAQRVDPSHEEPDGHTTFLLVALTPTDDSLDMSTFIIDPTMPNEGDAHSYLELPPVQRGVLELSQMVQDIVPPTLACVEQVPLSQELWKKTNNNAAQVIQILRSIVRAAAAKTLVPNPRHLDGIQITDAEPSHSFLHKEEGSNEPH